MNSVEFPSKIKYIAALTSGVIWVEMGVRDLRLCVAMRVLSYFKRICDFRRKGKEKVLLSLHVPAPQKGHERAQ